MARKVNKLNEYTDTDIRIGNKINKLVKPAILPEIEPCPFCGSEGRIKAIHEYMVTNPFIFVECKVCKAAGKKISDSLTADSASRIRAINAWNKRA